MADRLRPSDTVLELGCGYGRVLQKLASRAAYIIGIDTSGPSLKAAARCIGSESNVLLAMMDAAALGFSAQSFDLVVCIQNGISAFHIDPQVMIPESVRVTKKGGMALFSSYSEKFWKDRLEWFRIQAENGLVGEIDWSKTVNGEIVCIDGFRATTYSEEDFRALAEPLNLPYEIQEVDESSVFCTIRV